MPFFEELVCFGGHQLWNQPTTVWGRLFDCSAILGGSPGPFRVAAYCGAAGALAAGAYVGFPKLVNSVRRSFGWRPPMKMDVSPASVTNHGRLAESRFAGSAETAMSMAVGQVAVGLYMEGSFRVSGSGFRVDVGDLETLIVPAHVWEEVVARSGDRVVVRGKKADVELLDSEVRKHEIHTDVFLVVMPPNAFSKAGVGRSTIVPIVGKLSAKVAGPHGMGTFGTLSLGERAAFGTTWYHGTTLPGYSGSPYTVSGNIAAMHLRGAEVQHGPNIGVSAQMLYVTAKHVLNQRLEETYEWLTEMAQRKADIEYDQSWRSQDTVRVKVKGQFAIVDKDAMNSAYGDDWHNQVRYRDYTEDSKRNRHSALTQESSGNAARPGVLPSPVGPQGLVAYAGPSCQNTGSVSCEELCMGLTDAELKRLSSVANRYYSQRLNALKITSGQGQTPTI
ncbi:hypothetical protein 1 [Hubei sobemo-like virus 45]|uniref:hypothetical protein 1 n=1 Tax=Hubei sobemo-like virus 45 TaxID=1923233 RepID=UPI00090CCDD4|nr:hypothetical protein 1 [Hubei sobemo-like virus 45]APG75778.1 hypothetical protein 1 [Hubei sobemo-like virus 45]